MGEWLQGLVGVIWSGLVWFFFFFFSPRGGNWGDLEVQVTIHVSCEAEAVKIPILT